MNRVFIDLTLSNRGMIRASRRIGRIAVRVLDHPGHVELCIIQVEGEPCDVYVKGRWLSQVFPFRGTADSRTIRTMILTFKRVGDYWQCLLPKNLSQYQLTATAASRKKDAEQGVPHDA